MRSESTNVRQLLLALAVLIVISMAVSTDIVATSDLTRQDAQAILARAASAVGRAGSLHYALQMEMTMIPVHGQPWTSRSTMIGDYHAPDRLSGALTIANPWSETRSQIIVAGGRTYATHPQTGAWETVLKRAITYYPVIFTGCLLRMAEADMDGLVLSGWQMLEDEPVYHLKGMGGAQDEIEIEYWLGVEDELPRRAIARTGELPGWSDEAHTVRIAATLTLPGDRSLTAK
jgi:hypothetical protein